jgi:hypothetical protein
MAKKDLKILIEELNNSKTEEDIIKYLIKIVKGFNVYEYKDIVFNNPFYKSLIPDIKSNVVEQILLLRKSLIDEVDGIDVELKKVNNDELKDKLKSLKRDCISLIYEIDERQKDIDSLF